MTPEEEAREWWREHRRAVPKLDRTGERLPAKPSKPIPKHDCRHTRAISLTETQADDAVAYFAKSKIRFLKFPCNTCGGFHVVRSPIQPRYNGPRPRKPGRP